ncbi:MAG: response regulator transcription factor [Parvibaculales bacterium]
MRILFIDDDTVFANALSEMLEEQNIQVDQATCGKSGHELADIYDYEAILLDLGLPDMTGSDVLNELRKNGDETPVIVLSVQTEIETRLTCLNLGADDYLTKPVHSKELVARLEALVRRANGHCKNVLEFGELMLDLHARQACVYGRQLDLTNKEYQMLELLCLRSGRVVSKETFLDHLYGGIDEPEMKIIDVFICKLRKKISREIQDAALIETVWGRGYRANAEAVA